MSEHKLPKAQQSAITEAIKHLLAKARAGNIVAIGFVVVEFDDDGDLAMGTNATWDDTPEAKRALVAGIDTLKRRVAAKGGIRLS